MKSWFHFIIFFLPLFVKAQPNYDHNWLTGINGNDGNLLTFTDDSLIVTYLPQFDMTLEAANTTMSDENGNFIFYSNGCFVANHQFEPMDNGDGLNPGLMQQTWCQTGGNPVSQAILSLPDPADTNRYFIFHEGLNAWLTPDGSDFAPLNLNYSILDMSENGGAGKVIEKNLVALTDTLFRGFITAVRHANGSDWWVIAPKHASNCFFKALLSAVGVDSIGLQCLGEKWNKADDIGGQALFTPNGEKYIIYQPCHGLDVFDFDRCTGELSNDAHISMLPDSCDVGGVAVSPNSRFLYATTLIRTYQFDLWAPDIAASKTLIAEWDGYENPNPTSFWQCRLAPNNKIYIAPRYSTYNLHVINNPDSIGIACNLVQHGIELPGIIFSGLPNFPNFGLGAMPEPCDTTSSLGACIIEKTAIHVFPNPTTGTINLELRNTPPNLIAVISDVFGRALLTLPITGSASKINLDTFYNGVYFIQLYLDKTIFGKNIIIKV